MCPASPATQRPGSLLVVTLMLLGLAAASFAIWYQRAQTRRCLDFYGPEVARRVTKAPRVEVWTLAPADRPGRLMAIDRRDVSTARGIVHLRRGLVEDAGFDWAVAGPAGRLPADAWDYAFVFSDPSTEGQAAIVVDLDAGDSWIAVVGRPGRARLARLGTGLAAWIESALPPGK